MGEFLISTVLDSKVENKIHQMLAKHPLQDGNCTVSGLKFNSVHDYLITAMKSGNSQSLNWIAIELIFTIYSATEQRQSIQVSDNVKDVFKQCLISAIQTFSCADSIALVTIISDIMTISQCENLCDPSVIAKVEVCILSIVEKMSQCKVSNQMAEMIGYYDTEVDNFLTSQVCTCSRYSTFFSESLFYLQEAVRKIMSHKDVDLARPLFIKSLNMAIKACIRLLHTTKKPVPVLKLFLSEWCGLSAMCAIRFKMHESEMIFSPSATLISQVEQCLDKYDDKESLKVLFVFIISSTVHFAIYKDSWNLSDVKINIPYKGASVSKLRKVNVSDINRHFKIRAPHMTTRQHKRKVDEIYLDIGNGGKMEHYISYKNRKLVQSFIKPSKRFNFEK